MSSFPLLARQPIFNRQLQVTGYELLCRNTDLPVMDTPAAGDAASSQVLLAAFTELSLDDLVGQQQAYINFTRTLIDNPPNFAQKKLVVEVLEGQRVDEGMLQSLQKLRDRGYTIALDDFELTEETRALIAYADIIKLDVLALSEQQLQQHLQQLSGQGVQLLAEKIETYEMFEHCKALGFDLFQGYFLARPQVISGRKLSENKQAVLQLLSCLQDPDAPIERIERLIASDTLLSFKLLRLVNSAAFGLGRTVDSLRQAIMLLGLNKLRNWVNLLALSNLGGKPQELSATALIRARLCQHLGEHMDKRNSERFFTLGLLSTLDAFLDLPMAELLHKLALHDTLKQALLHRTGSEGKVLSIVLDHEAGRWQALDWAFLDNLGISSERLAEQYLASLSWTKDTLKHINTL